MPLYEYRCPECGGGARSQTRGDTLPSPCPHCASPGPLKRRWSLGFQMPMHEHFNSSVGKPISSMRQYTDELKRKSEIASITTGIEHRFVPVDPSDTAALGVTGDGIDESNRVREKLGMDLLPEIK